MQTKQQNDNDLELEVIATLQSEGYDQLKDMVSPLRRRMAEQTAELVEPSPLVVRISVVLAGLAAIGPLLLVELTG